MRPDTRPEGNVILDISYALLAVFDSNLAVLHG